MPAHVSGVLTHVGAAAGSEMGLSYDDIDLFARLRSITIIRGIVMPPKVGVGEDGVGRRRRRREEQEQGGRSGAGEDDGGVVVV
eukprot:3386579-Rhodomonas_salina.1